MGLERQWSEIKEREGAVKGGKERGWGKRGRKRLGERKGKRGREEKECDERG